MRLQIASDLHLELVEPSLPGYVGVEPSDADVLILAGDIAKGTRVFDLFAQWSCPVIFVPGNHEFYGSSIPDVLSEFADRAKDYPDIHVLAPGSIELGGVRFIGCTLWTDYDIFGPDRRRLAMKECGEKVYDHSIIGGMDRGPFTPEDARTLHLGDRAWLRDMLTVPFAGKTVVVTHHAAHPGSVHPRFANEITCAAFVSNLEAEIGTADLYIHGHTHDSFDYLVGKMRVLSNPMGYVRGLRTAGSPADLERENPDFDSRFTTEI
jgi:predicted phosphodiesterase